MTAKTIKPVWHMLVFLLALNVFAYGLDLPRTYSFFTAGEPKESAGFSFLFTRQKAETHTEAGITIPGPFLFEEIIVDAESIDTHTESDDSGSGILQAGEDKDRQKKTALKKPLAGEVIEAKIVILDQGFNVDEIFIPSVRIRYKNNYSFALVGRAVENHLIATFDFYELWYWFQNLSPHPGQVSLAVSGEGYRQDGTVFFFSGETMIDLKGSYDVRAIHSPENELGTSEDEEEKDDGSQFEDDEDDDLHSEIDPGDSDSEINLETDISEENKDQP